MGISVLNGGLYTTVQDMGRTGYQNLGISSSGAMDQRSFHIANLLLDNPENEAVLEFIQTGPKLRFTADTIIAITGGNFEPSLNGKSVPMYTAVCVHKNDILKFHSAKTGSCGYLAFLGKLDIPMVMGSRSTHVSCKVGGFCGRRLQTGDFICFREKKVYLPHFLSRKLKVDDFDNQSETIRVILGPQDDCFTQEGLYNFFHEEYTVTGCTDRMGYRLKGPEITHLDGADIISDGIAFGAIQVANDGQPMVMLADRPTTGGYTKIATVICTDLPKFVQKKAGDRIRFQKIDIEQAQMLDQHVQKEYQTMQKIIHQPCREVLEPRIVAQRIAELLSKTKQGESSWT